ncbi:MAG: hypothetical protein DCO97_03815 [Marivita sp. XM-24bin2]|nr:MAG: hypothetical protein DCO97_03815 [Marivita sp. XM-24bin2]
MTVAPGRRRGATVEFTASREEERTPRSCEPKPEKCDGGTREEETCHRRDHDIQGGGEDADLMWAVKPETLRRWRPGRRRGATVKSGTSREEERTSEPV